MLADMASCTRASVAFSSCRRSPASISTLVCSQLSVNLSASPKTLSFCVWERNPSNSTRRTCSSIAASHRSLQISVNRRLPSRSLISTCQAVDGNSPSSSTTVDAELPPSDKEQEADTAEGSAGTEEKVSPGKVLSQMRQERIVSGEEIPSKTQEFWRGVLEETKLIEWPSLQKVLGTTSVVTGVIVGASLVLLTVNALLAQLSDTVFKNAPPV